MASEQGTLDGTGYVPLSLSDKPIYRRIPAQCLRFFVRKPLGGFGIVVIFLVVTAALSADYISRYDPSESFAVEKPTCTAPSRMKFKSRQRVRSRPILPSQSASIPRSRCVLRTSLSSVCR